MENNIKLEPLDIDNIVEIKQESELLIEAEAEWLPTKFENEESEYYQEFNKECTQDELPHTTVKTETYVEQYAIEYLNGGEDGSDDDDYENVDYAEFEDETNMKNDSSNDSELNLDVNNSTENHPEQEEQQQQQDVITKGSSSNTNILCKLELSKWINQKYIKRKCPICNEILLDYTIWRRHIETNHADSIQESESNYYFNSENGGVCKKCNQEYLAQFPRYIHYIRHTENAAKLDICICKVCNFSSTKCFCVQKHIVARHPEVVKEFKFKGSFFNCPLCCNTYKQQNQLGYHFLDSHPLEYKMKFCYCCYLCEHEEFSGEELFLQHLIEKHELNSWQVLNYRKIFEDKEYMSCTKCNCLIFINETNKLLKHYLKHENNYYWRCKFCGKKTEFKSSAVSHMCTKMMRYFEKNYNMTKVNKIPKNSEKPECKINLQEFEEYMLHVCPFCNKMFHKMVKWQHHLRTVHKMDTLKGLEMKVIANDSNKLMCVICYTEVANSPEQLHAHRFQHLPYNPYKCLRCSLTLKTFKIAFNHILKRCEDEEDRDNVKNCLDLKMYKSNRSMVELQCSLCDCKKFYAIGTVLRHYKEEHNNFEEFFFKHPDNSMTCKVCHNKYVQSEGKFCFEHLHHHLEEKTYKCKLCSRTYHTYKSCYQHLLANHAKPLNQQSKGKNLHNTSFFLDDEYKVSHVTLMPQLGKITVKSHVLNEFAEFITYACPECNEGMTAQQNWHTHITTQHNFFDESNLYIKHADGSLKCPTCQMTLVTSITQQQKHKLTHMPYRSFICNLCYSRFNSLGVLYGHLRRLHFAEGTFECTICPEILKTSHQRTEHLKQMHPRNEWPTSMCLICYKILSTKAALNSHMATHDINRFKYTCNVCGAKIVELKDFNLHMGRHQQKEEVKQEEKVIDTFTLESGSGSYHSNDTDDTLDCEEENFNKSKTIRKSLATKKIKIDTQ